MKYLYKLISSTRIALLVLLAFASAMAIATFIENDYGTAAAWALIYNAWWFELLMVLLTINFIINIYKYKLYRKEKWPVLLFHIGFIVIIIGAGITRFTSYGGIMRIREGASSNTIISDENYLNLSLSNGKEVKSIKAKKNFSAVKDNEFTINTQFNETPISIAFEAYIPDALPEIVPNSEEGVPMLELTVAGDNGKETIFLKKGEVQAIGSHRHQIGFETDAEHSINIKEDHGTLVISPTQHIDYFIMATQEAGKLKKDSLQAVHLRTLYRVGDFSFVPMAFYPKGKVSLKSGAENPKENDKNLDDAVLITVSSGEEEKTIPLLYREGFLPTEHPVSIAGLNGSISYGAKKITTPFSIQLNDFQLERYPGSTSPSSYASEVTVMDGNETIPHRIFMNNVLDYKGYRFFQASYDTDELGTVLSVNHDRPGTYVTYLGYFLMSIGMFFTLFGNGTRFRLVNKKLKKLKSIQAIWVAFLLLGTNNFIFAQENPTSQGMNSQQIINKAHSDAFGRLLVQDLDGRIKPMNSLASEFLRKISGKYYFKLHQPNGNIIKMDANQTFLAMHTAPAIWQNIPIIKIDKKKGGDLFKELQPNDEKLVAFKDLLNEGDNAYILTDAVEQANQKKPAERNEFDKEVLKVDERFNILYNVFSGNYFKVFPNKLDTNETWFSYNHHFNDFPQEDGQFAKTITQAYFRDILNQRWEDADEKLTYISTYQKELGKDIIPSPQRIEAEIWYNRLNLNFWLFQYFFTVGLIMLLLAITKVFLKRSWLNFAWNSMIIATLIGFIVFAGNIVLRWYVAQHAPWSNGYEMLIFVAWCVLLCGMITYKKSDFTLPLASLFSGALLFVSYLDWLNPEITNLMPVLKSYWLKVHVATIVSSYAPLALAALIGIMALLLFLFGNERRNKVLNIKIKELTYVSEMAMTIGLFLLSIGTFLGGIWANESWGRYWAWDPKETWALISMMVYAVILHLRLIPGLKGAITLHIAAMFGFWSIIMTSFGVNYYLSGLHSYAAGDPLPIPSFVYYVASFMILLAMAVLVKKRKIKNTIKG
ncbi:cytochrome c biogenesis protein CcsA [Zhouia amylolytica]|uniref:Cytochrome c assembly protein n=1 Tax=Zhouia amylolytica AD3 TaxID=1286632 RepID=W2ULB4_9FLAO|nr:cytochrome c biogenesis protein CcsA [Zhouia amylolytica]ETN94231.1 cytochrome c assembly protein [Zhouia amylolytica AD3]